MKISLIFLVLAGVFVYFTLKGGYLTTDKSVAPPVGQSLTSPKLLDEIFAMDLRDYEGNKILLDQKALKMSAKLVIHLWASWCGPCVNEVPELIEFSRKNTDVQFMIVAVDDYQDDIEKFLKSFPEFNSKRYTRIWDRDKKISKFLDADRLPMSVIIESGKSEPQLLKAVVDWKHLKI